MSKGFQSLEVNGDVEFLERGPAAGREGGGEEGHSTTGGETGGRGEREGKRSVNMSEERSIKCS